MARRAAASTNVLARIRAWFGLSQDELGLYLGVSPALIRGIESSRRTLSQQVTAGTLALARYLPTPVTLVEAPLPTALPAGTPPPDAAALDGRRRVCLQRAARLREEAEQLTRQAHYAHRWAQALPGLLPPADTPPTDRTTWLTDWLQRRARPLSAEEATRWHLLHAQARALEAEATTLASLL
ncbi:helix-turn-helix transcriptional regulator [Hymenobacter sp. HSC-4F20]|uniref:helix-turn-helix domain-containing protein n=1 Tax=Hymenobacter sp. HSC-4F20 TaxID=2864135 RepID=UPI001C739F64|nr:helix-turn-helix transcriptional regulator [Hymenobacter sp. HSC-4F20]MBX0291493.1 helix-turn-helix transcriptional regulator [Hymenobacter sp. HSC-4F20]